MIKYIFRLGLTALLLLTMHAPAFAQLLITPLQVVMEGRDRSAQIVLINTSDTTNTYKIEWIQYTQIDGPGGYIPTDETLKGDTRYLKDFAVFTPRQITLDPGDKQTVRVAVRRPADLADGEYRSHLKFRILTSLKERNTTFDGRQLKDDEISLGVQVAASYTIPVVYRVGAYDSTISIGQPSFETKGNGTLQIKIPLQREGLHGVISEAQVFHTPTGGDRTLIGALGNANLFSEIDQRFVNVSTQVTGLTPGDLEIVITKTEGDSSNHKIVAKRTFPIQN